MMINNPPPWPNGARCAVGFSFDVDADSVVHATHRERALDEQHALAHMRWAIRWSGSRGSSISSGVTISRLPASCRVGSSRLIRKRSRTSSPTTTRSHTTGISMNGRTSRARMRSAAQARAKGAELIERLTGKRPRGYRAPYYGLSRRSFDLLIEAGMLYDSSLFADDIPIVLDNGKGSLVELPVPASVDDYNQYVSSRAFDYLMKISPPRHAIEVYRAEFDAMWELGGMWISVWHPAVSGRPAPALAIRGLIEYMQRKGDVL